MPLHTAASATLVVVICYWMIRYPPSNPGLFYVLGTALTALVTILVTAPFGE
ncbi:hypothetical protein HNQ71_004565 [Mesorhizobium sangaii]|uniref:Uncharacterized protein n=1 Tax=Mesorhizobium sangaii TaxID=505389 RepID=A0A841P9J1_9HYPH|nr:hypothetical protein [Mesorhizobium sangaii]